MAADGTMKQGEADRRTVSVLSKSEPPLPQMTSNDLKLIILSQTRANAFLDQMRTAFNRPNCGFYDADEGKHGGPDPNPGVNPNTGKDRARRTADNEDDLKEAAAEWCAAEMEDGYCKQY